MDNRKCADSSLVMDVLLRWDGRPEIEGRRSWGGRGEGGYLSLIILSNIDRRLQGNTAYLYLNDVTNFLGMEGMGRSFLGTLSL